MSLNLVNRFHLYLVVNYWAKLQVISFLVWIQDFCNEFLNVTIGDISNYFSLFYVYIDMEPNAD